MERLLVGDRVMKSHEVYTIGTSRVLTVASLQRLKIQAHIPAPANGEVQSVIKFLNAKSKMLIKIYRPL